LTIGIFSSGPITHETKVLDVIIGFHTNKVIFNVISKVSPNLFFHHWICFGLFYIIHVWIGIWRVFNLKHQNTRPWSVKPSLETYMAKIKMGYVMWLKANMGMNACKIWSRRKTSVVQEGLSAPNICLLKQKLLCMLSKKGNAFFIYVIPSIDVEPRPHKIPA